MKKTRFLKYLLIIIILAIGVFILTNNQPAPQPVTEPTFPTVEGCPKRDSQMATVKAKILSILDANNGRTLWTTIRDGLNCREQRLLPNALRLLKNEGIAKTELRVVDGEVIHEVFRLP